MNSAASHIVSTITGLPGFDDLVSGGLHWEFCTDEDRPLPIMTFTVEKLPGVSKDYGGEFSVGLFVFAPTLYDSGVIAETLEPLIKAEGWRFKSMRSGYTSDEAKEAYIEINYSFKL